MPNKRPPLLTSRRRAPITKSDSIEQPKTLTEQEEFKQLMAKENTINNLPTPPPFISVKQAISNRLSEISPSTPPILPFDAERRHNERPNQIEDMGQSIASSLPDIHNRKPNSPYVNIEVDPMETNRKRLLPPFLSIGQPTSLFEGDRRFAASLLDNIRRAAKSARLGLNFQQPQKHYGLPFDSCQLSNECVEGSKCARKAGLGRLNKTFDFINSKFRLHLRLFARSRFFHGYLY